MTATAELDLLRARLHDELGQRLPDHLHRLGWDADAVAAHQRHRLRTVLAHAAAHSPFHARRLRGFDLARIDTAGLRELPVMTKADMMAGFDDLLTDRRLTLRAAEAHLAASAQVPSLLAGRYVCLASGGSSGRRGVFVQTVGEYADFVASLMRRPMARLQAGGGRAGGLVIALVAAASPVHSTGFGAATTSGAPVQLRAVPATLPLTELVARLNAMQPPALMGYPTKLAQLAGEQRAGHLHIQPQLVTATSELLTAEDRDTITAAFGVPVVDQFASTEGLVGHSEPGRALITFATDMCLVEPVDADNQPVEPGAPAAKALITNLHNLTQPLIRYELSDQFVVDPTPGGGYLRARIDGRADDTFHYGTLAVHPHAVRTVLVNTPTVTEYQVHQTETGLTLDAVAEPTLDVAALTKALQRSLGAAGLPEPRVTVRTVRAVEPHPDTGKTRRFIPLEHRNT